ncbi:MAG: hypothetical protein RL625_1013, partial [Gemmatimonadota bacterium]
MLVLTAGFLLVEVLGGWLANSLALLADAGHMLTDVGALALSLFVAWFSRQPATPQRTYGHLRWEIVGALINGTVLLIASGWILWEAVERLRSPEPVRGGLMLGVALGGLLVNAIGLRVLHQGHDHASLNLRAAYLHVLGDLLGSVAAVGAAVLAWRFGWLRADPIASILMTALILVGAWRLVREALEVLLEAAPRHIDPTQVHAMLREVPGVDEIHDLHVWTLTSGVVALSAHAVAPSGDLQGVLEGLHAAASRAGVQHATFQVEGTPLAACTATRAAAITAPGGRASMDACATEAGNRSTKCPRNRASAISPVASWSGSSTRRTGEESSSVDAA